MDLGKTRYGPPEPVWGEEPRALEDKGREQLETTPPPAPRAKEAATEPAAASRPVRDRRAPAHLDPSVNDFSNKGAGGEQRGVSLGLDN